MKKETGVNRRQFLATASSAMSLAGITGPAFSEDQPQKSGADVSAPSKNTSTSREADKPQRSYTGAAAKEVAFPLGGIGRR